ncbi:hypothetical protein ABES02_29140 [Neobacillus pocheonensis]|uniref:hypothetical protein n=1 Tax=Neobacillus pocheonensis TaxID=363869 RepID=UPI003D28C9E2
MDKSQLPPVNLKAVFYQRKKSFIVEWLNSIIPMTEFEQKELVLQRLNEIITVVERHYAAEDSKLILHERFLNDFPDKCGIGPSKVEAYLSCTTTERKRWESEGRLPVVDQFNTGTNRKPIWVSMYCRRTIESLTEDILQQWRMDHETQKSMNRRGNENKVTINSRYVSIQALRENVKVYRIYGPVFMEGDEALDELWMKHKDKLPFEWEDHKCVVLMKDVTTDEIIRLQLYPGIESSEEE